TTNTTSWAFFSATRCGRGWTLRALNNANLVGFFLPVALLWQAPQDCLDLAHLDRRDPLAALQASLEAVEDVLPHRPRGNKPPGPLAATLELPLEVPLPGEPLGAQEAPLPR